MHSAFIQKSSELKYIRNCICTFEFPRRGKEKRLLINLFKYFDFQKMKRNTYFMLKGDE